MSPDIQGEPSTRANSGLLTSDSRLSTWRSRGPVLFQQRKDGNGEVFNRAATDASLTFEGAEFSLETGPGEMSR